jgi:hypothetical protein
VTGELLYSSTKNPDLPGVSPVWNGASSSAYAAHLDWNHQRQSHDFGFAANDIGTGFRADLGFLPQVGYREVSGYGGLRWYPQQSVFSFIRASFFADQQNDRDGRTIYRRTSPGVGINGVKNLFFGPVLHIAEQYRVGNKLLTATFLELQAQIDPSRRFTRIGINAAGGQRIDFANGRVGHGATIGLTSTLRPIDNLTFDANVSREWLDVAGDRLYTAWVDRLKTTYSFSAKSLVRIIGQYVTTKFPDEKTGGFNGSVLYSYRLNWQTVLFVGYGDDRVLLPSDQLARFQRSLFMKVSYAIQR